MGRLKVSLAVAVKNGYLAQAGLSSRLTGPDELTSLDLLCVVRVGGSPLRLDGPEIVTPEQAAMNFRVDLDTFRGPLDLLLYLVRKHEVDILDIPIAVIAEQFCEHMEVLVVIDVNAVGDFLEMASTLAEIKSRLVLPHGGEEEATLDDPREDLVQRLLEYKRFKDAASLLEDQSRDWQQRYARLVDDLPPRELAPDEQPIQEVELWDLVSAFNRIIRESQVVTPTNIVYDDTPIHVYMQRIHEQLVKNGRAGFSQMFAPGMHKSAMIGVFLAVLELVRHHSVLTEQPEPHGEIWILPGEHFQANLSLHNVDTYDHRESSDQSSQAQSDSSPTDTPMKPR